MSLAHTIKYERYYSEHHNVLSLAVTTTTEVQYASISDYYICCANSTTIASPSFVTTQRQSSVETCSNCIMGLTVSYWIYSTFEMDIPLHQIQADEHEIYEEHRDKEFEAILLELMYCND